MYRCFGGLYFGPKLILLLFFSVTRNSQYYEKVSDPLDLSTIEKQILTGHYKTVEAFDTDMLKVFRNAEVGRCPGKKTFFHQDRLE